MHIVFETPRLYLRQMAEEDASLVLQLNSDREVLKYVHETLLENEENAKEIIRNIIIPQYKNNLGRWAVYSKNNSEFIGWCGLKYIAETQKIDLGYRFLKSFWGKGFATEAARYTLKHGFGNLKIPTIHASAHIDNFASIRVLEKLGMKFIKNEFVDEDLVKTYEISVNEFSDLC